MSQNPSKPPLIKGGFATKSQSSVIKISHDKRDIGGFETKKNVGGLYKFFPYKNNLKAKARELRKFETEAEKVFWKKILSNKNIIKYKFTRQKPIDNFIADFYCSKLLLVVEIDGLVHLKNKQRDSERDFILEQKYNLIVVRYSNDDILNDMELVIRDFLKTIKSIEAKMRLKVPMIRGI